MIWENLQENATKIIHFFSPSVQFKLSRNHQNIPYCLYLVKIDLQNLLKHLKLWKKSMKILLSKMYLKISFYSLISCKFNLFFPLSYSIWWSTIFNRNLNSASTKKMMKISKINFHLRNWQFLPFSAFFKTFLNPVWSSHAQMDVNLLILPLVSMKNARN